MHDGSGGARMCFLVGPQGDIISGGSKKTAKRSISLIVVLITIYIIVIIMFSIIICRARRSSISDLQN